MIKVGIIGATAYTGVELFRILTRHPEATIEFGSSEGSSGKRLSQVYPELKGFGEMQLDSLSEIPRGGADVVFFCLPHKESMPVVPSFLEAGAKVIDIGADFRMNTAESYQAWYSVPHTAPHLLSQVVYGLPEINRTAISEASLVANPGCYPTSAILGLAPLLENGLIETRGIIIDSKSGISGAGKKLSRRTHFVESNENMAPYSIGRAHRHTGEIEQELSKIAGDECRVVFSPQVVPLNRGILSTIYTRLKYDLTTEEALRFYLDRYSPEPFVRIAEDYLPEARFVQGTNFCDIGLQRVSGTHVLIVVTALDNLVKGASGQAVQNMNIMFGLEETVGLV